MVSIESHEIYVPLPLVSTALNEQDTSLALGMLGEFE